MPPISGGSSLSGTMTSMPRQPEGKLVAKIKAHVQSRGGRCFKIHGDDEGFQEIGIPDLLICIAGRFVGAEVKQPGAKLRPRQKVVLYEIYEAGGVAAVLETVGQAAVLLSILEKETDREKTRGMVFDRGLVYRDHFHLSG